MSAATLTVLPDAERVVSAWLRDQPELAALVGTRVYTAWPARAGDAPLVLVRRWGGEPPVPRPLVLDLAELQADVYGGTKAQAWSVVATLRALAAERGTGGATGPTLIVRTARFLPDETFNPPRPRYVLDLDCYVRPGDARWTATETGHAGP